MTPHNTDAALKAAGKPHNAHKPGIDPAYNRQTLELEEGLSKYCGMAREFCTFTGGKNP